MNNRTIRNSSHTAHTRGSGRIEDACGESPAASLLWSSSLGEVQIIRSLFVHHSFIIRFYSCIMLRKPAKRYVTVSWGDFRVSWEHLGEFWGDLGSSGGHFGRSWGSLRELLGGLGVVLGGLGKIDRFFDRFWSPKGCRMGAIWEAKMKQNQIQNETKFKKVLESTALQDRLGAVLGRFGRPPRCHVCCCYRHNT